MLRTRIFQKFTLLAVSLLILWLLCELLLRFTSLRIPFINNSPWWELQWRQNVKNAISAEDDIDLYDPLLGWTLQPNLHISRRGNIQISSNSQGIRGSKEYNFQDPAKKRIISIGDSFTFGDCVSDTDTYTYNLGTRLPDTDVLNMGGHGYGTDQMLLKLILEGKKYNPDIVLMGYFSGDLSRNRLSFRDYAKPEFIRTSGALQLTHTPVPPPESLRKSLVSYVGLALESLWQNMSDQLFQKDQRALDDNRSLAILQQIAKTTQSIGARLYVVYLPFYEQGVSMSKPDRLYTEMCHDPHVVCIDPTTEIVAYLKTVPDPSRLFTCHYNPVIHEIIGSVIADSIRARSKSEIRPHP